jgi:catechol 2,3-dioxygenase-like lactoylglutathione lyase family enzyme
MIAVRRIDHVALRVDDVAEAAARWSIQFGLTIREADADRALLACDDEPYSLELLRGSDPGHDHTAFELRRSCELDDARAHLEARGVDVRLQADGSLLTFDHDENPIQLMPFREPANRLTAHTRPTSTLPGDHPRKLGHVNFLSPDLAAGISFYTEALGMRVTDYLGDAGVWFHVAGDHHVMALVEQPHAHFHHLAFDVVDIGQMRMALDHLARHGRWLGWGPARHGIGGNIASYVRIVEEACFVELYADMEQLEPEHEPRRYPDDRFSSNTWGPLPPRSYFRFDDAAIASERESWETRGVPLPESAAASRVS